MRLGVRPARRMAGHCCGRRAGPVPRLRDRAAHLAARRDPGTGRISRHRLGFAAVDDVRRRVQQQTTAHRGRKDDPLFTIRRLLRRGHDNHSERLFPHMLASLDARDVGGQIGAAWIAAQDPADALPQSQQGSGRGGAAPLARPLRRLRRA